MPRGKHSNHCRGNRHYRWNSGRLKTSEGYTLIRVGKGHPLADPNGYCAEHVLVWVAANGIESLRGREIHHVNGQRSDNRLENLVALTHRAHMVADGRLKLTDAQIRMIRRAFASGECLYDLGAHYGVAMQTVSKIVRGETRRSAGGPMEDRDHRRRLGKQASGRLLDGREWLELPALEGAGVRPE